MKATKVKTIKDIDTYRKERAIKGQTKSRYRTMVDLYGTANADKMMRELEVRSW